MPKHGNTIKHLHSQWISPYNNTDQIVFTTDGDVIYCQVCDKRIVCNKKSQVTQHVQTTFHKDALKRKINTRTQAFLVDARPKETSIFNKELCLSLGQNYKIQYFVIFWKSILQNQYLTKALNVRTIEDRYTMKLCVQLEKL